MNYIYVTAAASLMLLGITPSMSQEVPPPIIKQIADKIINVDSINDEQFASGDNFLRNTTTIAKTITFQEDANVIVDPDTEGPVVIAGKEWIFDSPQLAVRIGFSSRPSKVGSDGTHGKPYRGAGCCKKGRGGRRSGRDGRDGEDGQRGEDGETRAVPDIILIVGKITTRPGTIDLAKLDARLNFSGPAGGVGGNGGNGAMGETGGTGDTASMKWFKCRRSRGDGGNGGNGGDAGAAGNGGGGADGADILIYGPKAVLDVVRLFDIRHDGGAGGLPGKAGRPGRGGIRGTEGIAGNGIGCGGGRDGTNGKEGVAAPEPQSGVQGDDGDLLFLSDESRPVSQIFK